MTNIANILTMSRIAAIPLIAALLFFDQPALRWIAFALFAIACITDFFDGYIARRMDQVSALGRFLDPIADKLLVVAALVSLVSLNRLQAWVAMVIIARELAVTMSRMAATGQGVVISANRWGKAKTALQVLTIFLLIAVSGSPTWLDVLVYVTVAVTVISGIEYFFGLRRTLNAAKEREQAPAAPRSPRG